MNTRAIVGARVSVVRDASKVSHEIQHETGHRHADQQGWEVVGTFQDLDVSATVNPWDRPDLGPWLKDRANQWDAIIFAKVDRAFRSAKDCADVAYWVEQNRKVLVFTDDGITLDFRPGAADDFTSMMSKFFLTMASLFAEMELRRVQNRTRDAHRYLRTRDRWAGGQPPYGYRTAPHPTGGRTLEADPVTAEAVQWAGRWLLEGKSLWQIASALTEGGYPTPAQHIANNQGQNSKSSRKTQPSPVWNQSSLGKILRSPATMGLKMLGSKPSERRLARGDDGMPIRMAEPLFSEEEWAEIQRTLENRSRTKERSHGAAPLLGIVYCRRCEDRLYRVVNTYKNVKYDYYRCVPKSGKPKCEGHTFKAADLQELVTDGVAYSMADIPVTVVRHIPGEDHTAELEAVVKAMNDIRTEKDMGLYEYAGGDDEYRVRIASLVAQRQKLEAMPQRPAEKIEEPTGETYAQAYFRMSDPQERRSLLLTAGVRLYAGPNNFEFIVPEDLRERIRKFTPREQ